MSSSSPVSRVGFSIIHGHMDIEAADGRRMRSVTCAAFEKKITTAVSSHEASRISAADSTTCRFPSGRPSSLHVEHVFGEFTPVEKGVPPVVRH